MFVCEEIHAWTEKTIVNAWVCRTLSLKQWWHELVYWNVWTCSNLFNVSTKVENNMATSHEEKKNNQLTYFSRCPSGCFRRVDPQSITIQITLHVFSIFHSYRIHADVWYIYIYILTYIYQHNQLNVGKYAIHGWYGTVLEISNWNEHSWDHSKQQLETLDVAVNNALEMSAWLYLLLIRKIKFKASKWEWRLLV